MMPNRWETVEKLAILSGNTENNLVFFLKKKAKTCPKTPRRQLQI